LDRQARRLWVDFFNFWAQEQSQADGDLAAAFSKLEGYAARIALVCQLAMDSESVEVGPVAMRSGITLARWFAREAERRYAILAESEEQRGARALVEYTRGKGGSITARDLQKSNSRRYPTVNDAELRLQGLVSLGLAKAEERPTTRKGGHPTWDYVL